MVALAAVLTLDDATSVQCAVAAQQRAGRSLSAVAVRSRTSVVLDGVAVVDVETGRLAADQRVVIAGSRIAAVGSARTVRFPVGARVVKARGKYLIPGLWDMHAHPVFDTYTYGYRRNWADVFYPLFVAYGVTGVRDPGSNIPLATYAQWKQEIAAGMRVGPRLFVAGPAINGTAPAPGRPSPAPGVPDDRCNEATPNNICVATPSEARLAVDFLKQAGADFIKTYTLSKELYLAIAAEARRMGMPFGGHSTSLSGLEASDSGARFLDHQTWFHPNVCGEVDAISEFNSEQCAAAAERLRRNGTWIVETPGGVGLSLFRHVHYELARWYLPDRARLYDENFPKEMAERDSHFPGVPRRPTSFADWQAVAHSAVAGDTSRMAWARKFYAQVRGLPILAGTDVAPLAGLYGFPGYSLHEVLVCFVLGGMTPLEALQTATLNPAQALHATDSLGTVAPGKFADLVLLDANPLEDIWNTTKIRAVVANGRYFDRAALDQLMAQAKAAGRKMGVTGRGP